MLSALFLNVQTAIKNVVCWDTVQDLMIEKKSC